jgi:hypothetical protein
MSEDKNDKATKREEPLDEFKALLKEGEEIGKEIADQGRERTEEGQKLQDLSRTARNVLEILPESTRIPGIENSIKDWRFYVGRSRNERDSHRPLNIGLMTSTSSSSAISSGMMFAQINAIALPPKVRPRFESARRGFDEVIKRSADKEKVIGLMRSLQLHESFHGRKSSTDQFETAYNALNRPVSGLSDPANTSLIPMREAIETAIDHLLYLRPTRSNIGDVRGQNKDCRKVVAIGSQLGRDAIQEEQIQSWARDWWSLKKQMLSPAKTEPIDREKWIRRINQATVFLIGFLSGLDPKKLRDQ